MNRVAIPPAIVLMIRILELNHGVVPQIGRAV